MFALQVVFVLNADDSGQIQTPVPGMPGGPELGRSIDWLLVDGMTVRLCWASCSASEPCPADHHDGSTPVLMQCASRGHGSWAWLDEGPLCLHGACRGLWCPLLSVTWGAQERVELQCNQMISWKLRACWHTRGAKLSTHSVCFETQQHCALITAEP